MSDEGTDLHREQMCAVLNLYVHLAEFAPLKPKCVVLSKNEPIRSFKRPLLGRQMLEPLEMRCAPVGSFTKYEAAPGEKLEDVVT